MLTHDMDAQGMIIAEGKLFFTQNSQVSSMHMKGGNLVFSFVLIFFF